MAGFFTKFSIGITLMLLILTAGFGALIGIWSVLSDAPSVPTNTVDQQMTRSLQLAEEYQVAQDETEVNERTTDLAQLQGLVDTERGRANYVEQLVSIWNIVAQNVPGAIIATSSFIAIITLLIGGAVYALWRQVFP